ncbi:MAG: tetratricopeptide repeat protein [Anaerolineae bacterium]|nr:tetratricopeptide repeat protein [Anaerolineae bacterium]
MRINPAYKLLTVALCSSLLCACRSTPTVLEAAITQAAQYSANGEYSAAESLLQAHVASPDPAPAMALADLYTTWQRPTLGLSTLDAAQARGIRASDVLTRRLTLLMMDRQWQQAMEHALDHLRDNPDNVTALHAATEASLILGKCEDAAEYARQWTASAPASPRAALIYGLLYEDAAALCQVDDGLCALATGCEGHCTGDLGILLAERQDWGLANCALAAGLTFDADNPRLHMWLGASYARFDAPLLAEDHFSTAVTLDPDNPQAWLLYGAFALQTGNWETATKALSNAHQLDPRNPAPCLAIAELMAMQSRYEDMDTWVNAALARAVQDIDVWKSAARLYLSRHMVRSDMLYYITGSAVRMEPQDAEAHLLLGWAYLLQDQPDQAMNEIEQALELDGSLGQAHYFKGIILDAQGQTGEADIALTRAADLGYFP